MWATVPMVIPLRHPLLVLALWVVAFACVPLRALAGTWTPEVRLTRIAGQSWGPRIAAYAGSVHVVWFEYPNFTDPEVFYSRSSDNGTSWSPPRNISNNSGRPDTFPFVAADASGVYILWSSDSVNGDLFFKRSLDGGTTWGSEQQLTNAPGYSRSSGILVDSQGVLHVVWYDHRNGYSGVYHRQSCDDGASWTAEQWITQFDGIVDNEEPKITQGADNALYLLFRSSRDSEPQGGWTPFDMYLLRGQSTGCPGGTVWFQPAQRVSRSLPEEHSNNYGGTLVVGNAGRLHMVYWDERAGNNVLYRRGMPTGAGWGPPVTLSSFSLAHPESQGDPQLATSGLAEDSTGVLHAVFSEHAAVIDTQAVGRLFYRSSSDSGVTWNPVAQLGTSAVAASPEAVVQNNRLHVVWADFRDNNYGSELYYRNQVLDQPSMVTHYYNSILQRAPDPGGKAYWDGEVARTQALGIDLKEAYRVMAGNFFNSAEYLGFNVTDSEFVSDLYRTFFNRDPDPGGLSFWLGEINQGSGRNMVMYAFLFSPEFNDYMTNLLGNTSTRAEIYAIVDFYRGILDRLPDDTGFGYWLGRFRTAQCTGSAAVTAEVESISSLFVNSAEYAARARTNAQYVQDLYYAFTRRYATTSEVNYWVNALNGGAMTRDRVRQEFVQSPEFQGRVTAILNQGCLP